MGRGRGLWRHCGLSEQAGPTQRRWRRRKEKDRLEEEGRGRRKRRRKEEGRGRKTREKEAQTGIQADAGTWNTSCYSLEYALSGRLIAGACLCVCLSAASCETHRLGWGMWLRAQGSQPELWLPAFRPHLLDRL